MKGKSLVLIVVAVVALMLIIGGCNTYNGMTTSDQKVRETWGEVQNQYQRRSDLIPNLVSTVKGYATHEKDVLTAVVEARAKATQPQISVGKDVIDDPESFKRFQESQQQLTSALSRLLVVTEAYPELKSDRLFINLQTDLAGTENRIAVARGRFNTEVNSYNTRVRSFPANIFASMFGFQPRPYFEATPGSETAPKVEF
jgi:LemA protein